MSMPDFQTQQEIAAKRVKDLNEDEKIYLLKKEVKNLRKQIRDRGAKVSVPAKSETIDTSGGGMCSNGSCSSPMLLVVFLVLGVLAVNRWRRRNGRRSGNYSTGTGTELGLQFELQDTHETQPSPSTTTSTFHEYQAPASATTQIQFF